MDFSHNFQQHHCGIRRNSDSKVDVPSVHARDSQESTEREEPKI
jgi:hypothetical protein